MNKKILILSILSLWLITCGKEKKNENKPAAVIDWKQDKGVGTITSVELGAIDDSIAASGQKLFEGKCSACHKLNKRYIGPAMASVTKRRTGEWIMNMILNPEKMVKENAAARKLLMEYSAPMANQSLTEKQARSILEYFRKLDSK